jgi:hypothetical protein
MAPDKRRWGRLLVEIKVTYSKPFGLAKIVFRINPPRRIISAVLTVSALILGFILPSEQAAA